MDEICLTELRAALDGVEYGDGLYRRQKSCGSEAPPDSPTESETTKTLWMGDLAHWMDESFLARAFKSEGEVVSPKIIRNKTSGLSEGYGFIEFPDQESAAKALADLNGKTISGTDQAFRLNWAAYGIGKSGSEGFSVFVGDLAIGVTDIVLQEHFKRKYPSVRSAKVITDANTGRHKGYGFVRFASQPERDLSLEEMQGHVIDNRPIRVSAATAKKAPSCDDGTSSSSSASATPFEQDSTNSTLFIGGLSEEVTESQLFAVFSPHGEIVYTKIPQGRGCGFVQFVHRKDAEEAKTALHGQLVGKTPIRVSWGRQQGKRISAGQVQQHFGYHHSYDYFQGYYDNTAATYYDPYAGGLYPMMPMELMYQMYPHAMPMPQQQPPFMPIPCQPYMRMDMQNMHQAHFVPRPNTNLMFGNTGHQVFTGHHLPVS